MWVFFFLSFNIINIYCSTFRSTIFTYHSPYAAQQSTENEFFKINKKFAPTPPKKGRPISAPVYKIG